MAKTEIYASFVAYVTYASLSWTLVPQLSIHCTALVEGSLLILVFLKFTANLQSSSAKGPCYQGWELRRYCSDGLYCVPLLPHAVLVTVLSEPHDPYRQWQAACAVTLLLSSTCALLLVSLGGQHWSVWLGSAPVVAGVVMVTMNTGLGVTLDAGGFCLLCLVCAVATTLQLLLPRLVPLAFSVGEAAICSHAATYFLFTALAVALHKNGLLMTDSAYLSLLPLHIGFLQVVVMSCGLVIAVLYLVPRTRCSVGFYSILFAVIGCISTPVLWLLLKQNFISWLLNFVTSSTQKAYMFVYWATCSFLVSGLVWFHNHRLCHETAQHSSHGLCNSSSTSTTEDHTTCQRDTQSCAPSSQQDTQNCAPSSHCAPNSQRDAQSCAQSSHYAPSSKRDAQNCAPSSKSDALDGVPVSLSIVDRKHFHIVAILTFLPGIALDCQMANMAGTCAIVVFAMLECQRLLSVWPYGEVLGRSLQLFVDSRDEGPVIVTHIYLLAGCVLPLWLTNSCTNLHSALFSGLLSLGIGDTAAAVVGSKLGTHPWPGSKKTLEGTAAAVVCQFLALFLLHSTGYITVAWWTGLLAVTLTSLLEAFTSQIDNLILPLYMYMVLVNS